MEPKVFGDLSHFPHNLAKHTSLLCGRLGLDFINAKESIQQASYIAIRRLSAQ